MGLAGVELVLALEERFQIAITDADAQQMRTPSDVVNHILRRVPSGTSPSCLEQRAFYRLRRAAMQAFSLPRPRIHPNAQWVTILPRRHFRHSWHVLHLATGTPGWPRLSVFGNIRKPVLTVGAMARYLAVQFPASFRLEPEGWSQEHVEQVVKDLIREIGGITTFQMDQDLVKDLGFD